jgi:hypothetical protein
MRTSVLQTSGPGQARSGLVNVRLPMWMSVYTNVYINAYISVSACMHINMRVHITLSPRQLIIIYSLLVVVLVAV